MKHQRVLTTPMPAGKRYLVLPLPGGKMKFLKSSRFLWLLLILSHSLSWFFPSDVSSEPVAEIPVEREDRLFLAHKAANVIQPIEAFEEKVREISAQLHVPPAWLMAVMDAESGFRASVANRKGSGAVGLIQFMPTTAKELSVSTFRLKQMNPLQQLEYVFRYFQQVRERYGDYTSLTDFYLAVLYPKARHQSPCYTLYAKPSKAYSQNAGLDQDKDGRVTVHDVDLLMQHKFGPAYNLNVPRT